MNKQATIRDWKELDATILFRLHRQIAEQSSNKQSFLRLIKNIFINQHHYDVNIDSQQRDGILFFYSADYYRSDHIKNFKNVVACCDHASVVEGTARQKTLRDISLTAALTRLLRIPALFRWHRKQWGAKPSFWKLLPFYFVLEDQWRFLSKLDLARFQALVVYYDAWFTDAALVQLFKSMGKKTATLQHAFFAAKNEKSSVLGENGIELECSNADLFLAWNEATVIEAKKQGVDTKKFRILGIPRYIGQDLEDASFDCDAKKNRFGVVLGVKDNEAQNIAMVQLANIIAEKYGYKYYLKYHPAFSGTEYSNYVKSEYYLGNIEKMRTLAEYAADLDFSIAGNSTVMMELLYLKHKTFHYTDKQLYEKYSEMQEITFSNFEEFEDVYQVGTSVFEMVRLRYCGPQQSEQKYKAFFKNELLC